MITSPAMKTLSGPLSIALLSAALAGCNGGASDPITRIESQYHATVNAVCAACPGASGSTAEADCRAQAEADNPFMGPEFECQRTVYGMYPDQLRPYYDCQANALVEYDACIRGAVRTCPPVDTAVMACTDQLSASGRACPLPDSVAAGTALANCFGP